MIWPTPRLELGGWVRLLEALREDASRRWITGHAADAEPPMGECMDILAACDAWDAWTDGRALDPWTEVRA